MKYLPLLWAGIARKRIRAILTALSILNAFLLFGLLQGFAGGLDSASKDTNADILFTGSRLSQLEPLPLSLAQEMKSVAGVEMATPVVLFQSTYRLPSQVLRVYAVEPDQFLRAGANALKVSPAGVKAINDTRTGAVVSRSLAATYGWKIGDRVTLNSMFWPNANGTSDWPVDIVAFYDPRPGDIFLENAMLVRYDYVDEGRVAAKGTANFFLLKLNDASASQRVSNQVDALFANSSHETVTSSERQLVQTQVKQIGDINLIVRAVVGAVLVALLLSVGAVMMQAVRERTREFAVLKTLGFSDRRVLVLILAEVSVMCLVSAVMGLVAAQLLFPMIRGFTGFDVTAGDTLVPGLLIALVLALASGLPPALVGMRLRIVDALAGR